MNRKKFLGLMYAFFLTYSLSLRAEDGYWKHDADCKSGFYQASICDSRPRDYICKKCDDTKDKKWCNDCDMAKTRAGFAFALGLTCIPQFCVPNS